jgi:hypothetical protein
MRARLKIIFIFSFALILNGCMSDNKIVKTYLKHLDIELQDKFEIHKCETNGITDFVLEMKIKISKADCKRIIEHLKNQEIYTDTFPSDKRQKSILDTFEIVYRHDSMYHWFKQVPDKSAFLQQTLSLNPKTMILEYMYYDE